MLQKYNGFVYQPWFMIKDEKEQEALIEQMKYGTHMKTCSLEKRCFDAFRDEWSFYYNMIDNAYDLKRKVLKKGTRLYRGSFDKNFDSTYQGVRFFGLDFPISAWILTETFIINTFQKNTKNIKYADVIDKNYISKIYDYNGKIPNGYIHEFVIEKPMKYHYIQKDGTTPLDSPHKDICESKLPCVHPQSIYHYGFFGSQYMAELGTELTLPGDFFRKHVKHVKTHIIDVNKLFIFHTYNTLWWLPHNAVVRSISHNK